MSRWVVVPSTRGHTCTYECRLGSSRGETLSVARDLFVAWGTCVFGRARQVGLDCLSITEWSVCQPVVHARRPRWQVRACVCRCGLLRNVCVSNGVCKKVGHASRLER
jgi:hypothetical protein